MLDETELTDPGVDARHGIEQGSQSRDLAETELTDPRVDVRHGIERGSLSWTRQSSLILASMRAVGSGEAVSFERHRTH